MFKDPEPVVKQKYHKYNINTGKVEFVNKRLIEANPGSGKSRYIKRKADKLRDIIIVISNVERDKYIELGFKRVYTY